MTTFTPSCFQSYLFRYFSILVVVLSCTLNLNTTFVKSKKFSPATLWICYNFIVLEIAFWIISKSNKIDDFDGKQATLIEANVLRIITVVGCGVGAIFASLLPGIFAAPQFLVAAPMTLVIYVVFRGIVI